MWRWTRRILVGLIGLFLLAVVAGATYQWVATRKELASTPPPGQLVDVGGHRLHLWCTGVGAPPVILETGLGGSSADWGFVQPEIARFTRVCSYDRAGMGYSDPGPSPRTARHIARRARRTARSQRHGRTGRARSGVQRWLQRTRLCVRSPRSRGRTYPHRCLTRRPDARSATASPLGASALVIRDLAAARRLVRSRSGFALPVSSKIRWRNEIPCRRIPGGRGRNHSYTRKRLPGQDFAPKAPDSGGCCDRRARRRRDMATTATRSSQAFGTRVSNHCRTFRSSRADRSARNRCRRDSYRHRWDEIRKRSGLRIGSCGAVTLPYGRVEIFAIFGNGKLTSVGAFVDLGCGRGILAPYLSDGGYHVHRPPFIRTAADRVARRVAPAARFIQKSSRGKTVIPARRCRARRYAQAQRHRRPAMTSTASRPEAKMPRIRRRLTGPGLLLAAAAVACSDSPISPTSSGPQSPASRSTGTLEAVVETRRCTFGAGYWKTHPLAWPARFDPDAIFYTSGMRWIEVLRTPPEGDPYYILAHQFIAAGLNLEQLDPDIRPDEVGEPWEIAGSGYFTDGAHSDHTRTELLEFAGLLEIFNEGNGGVPPCR